MAARAGLATPATVRAHTVIMVLAIILFGGRSTYSATARIGRGVERQGWRRPGGPSTDLRRRGAPAGAAQLGDRTLDEPALHRLQAEVLEQLVKQQLVLAALEKRGEACNQEQVDLALSRLKDTLNRQEKTLDDYCREQGTCRQALEHHALAADLESLSGASGDGRAIAAALRGAWPGFRWHTHAGGADPAELARRSRQRTCACGAAGSGHPPGDRGREVDVC